MTRFRPTGLCRSRILAVAVAVALSAHAAVGGAEPLPEYPALASPFGVNQVFDYSEEQAELQRLDPAGVMAVIADRDLPHLAELGIRHYRVRPGEYAGFAYDRMAAGRGSAAIDFSRTDALVSAAQDAGLDVLPVLALHRDAAGQAEQGRAYVPRDLAPFAAWVRAVVERYDGDGEADMPRLRFRIGAWQVGEAPDQLVALEDGRYATIDDYVRVLEAAAGAVHGADATAQVVLGAVTSLHEDDNGVVLLDAVLAAPVAASVDVLAFEHLPRSLSSVELRDAVKGVRQRAGDRPIWCTLSCSYSRYTPRNAMRDRGATEETQGTDLVRRYSYMLANGVERIYEAGITEEGPDKWKRRTYHSGLRSHDGAPKLAYSAHRLLVRIFSAMDLEKSTTLRDGQDDMVVLQFQRRRGLGLVYVLWWDYAATQAYKTKTLEPDIATQISLKLTDEIVEVGEMVQGAIGPFKTALVRPQEGELQIPMQRIPVLLQARAADTTAEGE